MPINSRRYCLVLNKKAYLTSIADRISCEADAEREWDAYQGSALLLRFTWDFFEKRGRQLGVSPQVAGYMLQNGLDRETASAVFEPARRKVVIG